MRLLILAYDFKPNSGGIAEVTHQLAFHLQRRGNPVRVISRPLPGDGEFDRTAPYSVLRSSHWEHGIRERWKFLAVEIERFEADYVFSNVLGSGSVFGSILSRWKGKRFLISAHGMDLSRSAPGGAPLSTGVRFLRQWISYRGAERILCHCSWAEEILIQRGVDPSRLVLSFPGVSPGFLAGFPSDGCRVRRRWGVEGRLVVLTLCRLVERKGVHLMVEAIARLVPRFPELSYLIAGEGPCRDDLERLARDLGIESRVIFTGAVSEEEKRDYFDAADLFAMPNQDLDGDCEGFGLVFLEAAVRGKAVIGGRAGGVSDAIEDGETGLLIEPGNIDELSRALEELLSDPDRRLRMGTQGRRRVLQHFTWDRAVDRLTSEVFEVL